jgi:hypothetical protein
MVSLEHSSVEGDAVHDQCVGAQQLGEELGGSGVEGASERYRRRPIRTYWRWAHLPSTATILGHAVVAGWSVNTADALAMIWRRCRYFSSCPTGAAGSRAVPRTRRSFGYYANGDRPKRQPRCARSSRQPCGPTIRTTAGSDGVRSSSLGFGLCRAIGVIGQWLMDVMPVRSCPGRPIDNDFDTMSAADARLGAITASRREWFAVTTSTAMPRPNEEDGDA